MVDGARGYLGGELEHQLVVPDVSAEPCNRADVEVEVMDDVTGGEGPELHGVLDVVHVAGDQLVQRHSGSPLQHVHLVLGYQVHPGGFSRVGQVNADQLEVLGILVCVEDDLGSSIGDVVIISFKLNNNKTFLVTSCPQTSAKK